MNIRENTITTMIVNSDDNSHNFEITRMMSGDGVTATEEAMLITICPSDSALGEFKIDSTSSYILNHLANLNLKKCSMVYLFSAIPIASRMSSRNLAVDEENMKYIEERFKDKKFGDTKVIIAWGSSLAKSDAANLSKKRVIEMYRKYHPSKQLYELGVENDTEGIGHFVHPLYLGINSKNKKWVLVPFDPPKDLLKYESKKTVTAPKHKKIGESTNSIHLVNPEGK